MFVEVIELIENGTAFWFQPNHIHLYQITDIGRAKHPNATSNDVWWVYMSNGRRILINDDSREKLLEAINLSGMMYDKEKFLPFLTENNEAIVQEFGNPQEQTYIDDHAPTTDEIPTIVGVSNTPPEAPVKKKRTRKKKVEAAIAVAPEVKVPDVQLPDFGTPDFLEAEEEVPGVPDQRAEELMQDFIPKE